MSVRATPASAVPAFTSASAQSNSAARAALSFDPHHPNAHLLSSLMANATPAMAVRAATSNAPLTLNGGGMHSMEAAQLQVQMGMAAYYQQMQVMMVNYMTAMQQQQQQQQQRQQQQQQAEQAVEAITHKTIAPGQQQRLSPSLTATTVAQPTPTSHLPAGGLAAFAGYSSMNQTAAAAAAQQMSATLAQMAAATTGQSLTQQQQAVMMQHMQQRQQQQEQQEQQQQYQMMVAHPALLAQFATPHQSPPSPHQQQPLPTQPLATTKQPSSAPVTSTTTDHIELAEMPDGVVRCVCGSFHRTGKLLACGGCGVLQHRSCIGRTPTGKSGGASEYYCELCEPTAPVHVGRELMMQRKEREWKAKLKGGGGGNRRKRRREDGGEGGVCEVARGGEGGAAVDEDDEMKRLTEMFRAEIDTGLFESDTERERADEQRCQSSEREQVKVEEELKQEITKARQHVEQHKTDVHTGGKDVDTEERKETPAPLQPLRARHHRIMTDSEKDAAAAISLLSPRPPLAPLTVTSTVRASPPSAASSVRSSPARSRFVFPTEGLLTLSPHRSTSSPSASSASSSSAVFFSSASSSASSTCASTSRLFDQLLRPSPFVSPTSVRNSSGRGSLSVPSSPISKRGTSVLFSTRQAGLIGRSPRAVLLSSTADGACGLLTDRRPLKPEV